MRPDLGKKICYKIGFFNLKNRNLRNPLKIILIGVIALAYFDPRSFRGLRGYLSPQFEKMLIWHWSPKHWKF
jgi:hypothetical protein